MRIRTIACFLSLGLFQGSSLAGVALKDPVITVNGPCPDPNEERQPCVTVITREEFEGLTEALEPGMSPSKRLAVANSLVRIRRMSEAAQKRGLDQTAAFREEMLFARMQLLSQDLMRMLRADASNIAESDVYAYYTSHPHLYERAAFARIFVPHGPAAESDREAEDLHDRAVEGEDPDQLQRIAFAHANIGTSSVNTKLEDVRRTDLPVAHEAAFDLHPGEVSTVFSDPSGGYFIYKMLTLTSITLDEARSAIRELLAEQRYRDAVKVFEGGFSLNDAYFNPPEAHPSIPARRTHQHRALGSADP